MNEDSTTEVLTVYVETRSTQRRFMISVRKRKAASWRVWESNALDEPIEVAASIPGTVLAGFFQ
ncbi:MAG: hypothetical protein IPK60_17050 [Sandaracinaceae bacterium]|nr:hypothetical protein [Sandaracinaceae bacterium]